MQKIAFEVLEAVIDMNDDPKNPDLWVVPLLQVPGYHKIWPFFPNGRTKVEVGGFQSVADLKRYNRVISVRKTNVVLSVLRPRMVKSNARRLRKPTAKKKRA